jgi:hypothetical protein
VKNLPVPCFFRVLLTPLAARLTNPTTFVGARNAEEATFYRSVFI